MTTEQKQEIAEIAEEAVINNDVSTLQNLWKIIKEDVLQMTISFEEQTEWFESLLTSELHLLVIT